MSKVDLGVEHIEDAHCPLVMIEWVDSAQPIPMWLRLRELNAMTPVQCVSVGWLVFSDSHTKVLAPNMAEVSDPGQVQACGLIRIPTKAVSRIVVVEEAKDPTFSEGP